MHQLKLHGFTLCAYERWGCLFWRIELPVCLRGFLGVRESAENWIGASISIGLNRWNYSNEICPLPPDANQNKSAWLLAWVTSTLPFIFLRLTREMISDFQPLLLFLIFCIIICYWRTEKIRKDERGWVKNKAQRIPSPDWTTLRTK